MICSSACVFKPITNTWWAIFSSPFEQYYHLTHRFVFHSDCDRVGVILFWSNEEGWYICDSAALLLLKKLEAGENDMVHTQSGWDACTNLLNLVSTTAAAALRRSTQKSRGREWTRDVQPESVRNKSSFAQKVLQYTCHSSYSTYML